MKATILLTTNRGISPGTHSSLMEAVKELGVDHKIVSDGGLDRARGLLVTNWFMTTRDDAFIMVDDDMVFTPDQLMSLYVPDLDIVSAAYPTRHGESLTGLPVDPTQDTQAFFSGGMLELESAGMGCILVQRRVIAEMINTTQACWDGYGSWFWPFFLPMVHDTKYFSEDAAFCFRVREAGFRIWLNTAVRTTHLCNGFPVSVDNLTFVRQANEALKS